MVCLQPYKLWKGGVKAGASLSNTKTFSPFVTWDEELNNVLDIFALLICYTAFIDS